MLRVGAQTLPDPIDSIGAPGLAGHILLPITGESLLLSLLGIAIGLLILYGSLVLGQPNIENLYGLCIPIGLTSHREWIMLGLT